jgi:hypothetical protein
MQPTTLASSSYEQARALTAVKNSNDGHRCTFCTNSGHRVMAVAKQQSVCVKAGVIPLMQQLRHAI